MLKLFETDETSFFVILYEFIQGLKDAKEAGLDFDCKKNLDVLPSYKVLNKRLVKTNILSLFDIETQITHRNAIIKMSL